MIGRRVLTTAAKVTDYALGWMLCLWRIPPQARKVQQWIDNRAARTYEVGEVVRCKGEEWTVAAKSGESLFLEQPGGKWHGCRAREIEP
jgi:hypothetical protein